MLIGTVSLFRAPQLHKQVAGYETLSWHRTARGHVIIFFLVTLAFSFLFFSFSGSLASFIFSPYGSVMLVGMLVGIWSVYARRMWGIYFLMALFTVDKCITVTVLPQSLATAAIFWCVGMFLLARALEVALEQKNPTIAQTKGEGLRGARRGTIDWGGLVVALVGDQVLTTLCSICIAIGVVLIRGEAFTNAHLQVVLASKGMEHALMVVGSAVTFGVCVWFLHRNRAALNVNAYALFVAYACVLALTLLSSPNQLGWWVVPIVYGLIAGAYVVVRYGTPHLHAHHE